MVDKEFSIRNNETEEEYIMRACELGLTLGLTWREIANIINEETERNSDESTYRRRYKAYSMGVKAGREKKEPEQLCIPIDDASKIEDVGEEFLAYERKTRDRYVGMTERSPFYRLTRQDTRFERFYKLVAEQIKEFTPPDPIPAFPYRDGDELEYVLGLADLHIGSCFVGVNNSYSIDEAQRRFEFLLSYMADFVQRKGISKLKILFLGDTIQGILRISDLRLNELPVVDAFVRAMRMIANFLNRLSAYCDIEFLMVAYSNHDQLRPLGTKASELASEDLGKVLYAYLCDCLAANNRISITSDVDNNCLQFKIFDFNCKAMHGHDIPNPATVCKDLANRDRVFYDYVFLGHSHSAREMINAEGAYHNVQTLVLGSFIGSCPYADKLMVGSKASCSVYGFHPKYGHIETYTCILN